MLCSQEKWAAIFFSLTVFLDLTTPSIHLHAFSNWCHALKKNLSQNLSDLPVTYSTPEIRVYTSDQVKFKIVDEVKKELAQKYPIIDIDGVRAIYPNGWALVRPSNTQEILVLRFEADSKHALQTIRNEVEKTIEDVISRLEKNQ